MRKMIIDLLKELNEAYPNPITIRTLKENGHEITVIQDAIDNNLVESTTILSSVADSKLNNKEKAVKLSFKGSEYLEQIKESISTTHKGNTTIKVNGNGNILGLGQSHGQVNIEQSKQINQDELVLPPDNPYDDFYLKLGGKLLKILSGSLENGINKVVSVSLIIVISNIFVLIDAIWTKLIFKSISWLALPIIFIVIFAPLIRLKRRCENCKKYFAYKTLKRTKLGEGEYQGEKFYNIKEIDKCRFCGHEKKFFVVERETPS